jgi:hypothetical protein
LLALAVSYIAAVYPGQSMKLTLLRERVFLVSTRLFGVPSFSDHAIADGIYNFLFPDKTASRRLSAIGVVDFQFLFGFG